MTALSDHITLIKDWLNFEYSDALVTSWIRMAEQTCSLSMRSKHMIQIDTGTLVVDRVLLPSDWLELDFVRLPDGKPLSFRERTQFYTPNSADEFDNQGYYTLTGNYLIIGNPDADGKLLEISYYQEIPPLGDTNWMMTHYSGLYTFATLAHAYAYAQETEQAASMQAAVDAIIGRINDGDKIAKTSGSLLKRNRPRSY